jgi:hypothetical protein
MNSREFLTQALLSCHRVLMDAALPDDLPDDDELLDSEIRPIAEKIAIVATIYATELASRWQLCMDVQDRQDRESVGIPSTENLTKPPPEVPPSNN